MLLFHQLRLLCWIWLTRAAWSWLFFVGSVNKKQAEWCPRSQINGLKFLQESSKKIIHLFIAHMLQLPQIAHSTVLRMQICFAWKSIWSCSKESRTALLLSPLAGSRGAPSRRLSPLTWKTFHQLHTHGHPVSGSTFASDGLKHHGPICRSRRPVLAGLTASRTRSPATVCSVG